MPTHPYIVNVSSILDYQKCRWRWVAKWVVNRVPRNEPRPLRFGKLLHLVFEDHFRTGKPMAEVIAKRRDEWYTVLITTESLLERSLAKDAIDDLDAYTEPLSLWKDSLPTEGKPLEIEKEFLVASPLDPTIWFKGRPDRHQLMYGGQMFHWQNRGLAASVNFPLYVRLQKRNMHEHLYGYAAQQRYPSIQYGGTVYNLLKKLKYRGKPTKVCPEGKILHSLDEIFWQGVLTISPELNAEMMEIMTRYAQEMRFVEECYRSDGVWPLPNETIHGGPYGNSEDIYFRVLNGEARLEDNIIFKDREDTYATVEPEASSLAG